MIFGWNLDMRLQESYREFTGESTGITWDVILAPIVGMVGNGSVSGAFISISLLHHVIRKLLKRMEVTGVIDFGFPSW